jgi:hypothetical protein
MFGSSLPSALGWLVTTKVYSGTGADIVMESITLTENFCSSRKTAPPQKEARLAGAVQKSVLSKKIV